MTTRPRRTLFGKPTKGKPRTEIVGRSAGRAGLIASAAMALVGVALGALAAFVGGQGQTLQARYSGFDEILPTTSATGIVQQSRLQKRQLRIGEDKIGDADRVRVAPQLRVGTWRDDIVEDILGATVSITEPAEHPLDGALLPSQIAMDRPRIAIVFDDMGLDRSAFEQLISLPGPVTFSFLPYANNSSEQALIAAERGDSVMLHLPMEPVGKQNPGPRALKVSSSVRNFDRDLIWNLNQLTGYSGVNNHMGSRFTANQPRMTRVLNTLRERNVYFLDSVTTPNSVAQQVARKTGTLFVRRDVFLDPKAGRNTVKRQLAQTEEIARRTGYAIAIAHPRPDTISVIGPWLASASARGFELVTMDQLVNDLHELANTTPIARVDG